MSNTIISANQTSVDKTSRHELQHTCRDESNTLMRECFVMDLWFTLWLFWGYVRADSFEVEDGEPNIPCVPILYKCYTTDDCCSGTCVRAKWSKHLVCLVAGYKEDIKLDRIGQKKVGPMDLEYLKNMYGFAVDYNNLDQIRDFETILDPFYSSTTGSYDSTSAITDSLNVKPDISRSTDPAGKYDSTSAITDLLDVKPEIYGRTDTPGNYNSTSTITDSLNVKPDIYGSTDATGNYNSTSAITDSLNVKPDIYGSTDATGNYNSTSAITDSLNVKPDIYGSTDATGNYNSIYAITDSLNENHDISGSTDAAGNYGSTSSITDSFNIKPDISGSTDETGNYDITYAITDSLNIKPEISGSTDAVENYNSTSAISDSLNIKADISESTNANGHYDSPSAITDSLNVNQSLNFETTLNATRNQLNITVNRTSILETNHSESFIDDSLSSVSNYSSLEFLDENRKQYNKQDDLVFKNFRRKRSLTYSLKEENNVDDIEENNVSNVDDIEEREYGNSYIDPFSSYVVNANRPTLVDNITSQIKQSDSEFKSLSYSSLETLLQNLTGYEFQLPNFSWPLHYNKTPTSAPSLQPVTVPERLWNLLIHVNSSDDYSDLDFGETYDLLKGNYSEQWLLGQTRHEGLGDFSGVNRFFSSFHFFKDKHNETSVSSWQKVLEFVHRDKNTTNELKSDNATIVVSVKDKWGNKSAWKMLTGLFHSDHDTIKLDILPRNLSESSNATTLEDLIDCPLASNISCLLWSILNRNKTDLKPNNLKENVVSSVETDYEKEKTKSRLMLQDKLKTKQLKSSRFIEEVKFIDKTPNEDNSITLVNTENTTKLGKWEKFKNFFKKGKNTDPKDVRTKLDGETNLIKDDDNLWSSKENDDAIHEVPSSDETYLEKIDMVKENQTGSLWDRFKNVVLFKSVPEAVTSSEGTPTTDLYDFMKRYWDWSAARVRYLNRTKEQHPDGEVSTTDYTDSGYWNLWNQVTETNTLPKRAGPYSENSKPEFVDGNFYRNIINQN